MSNRKLCLISQEIGQLLVKQLAHELKNYNLYQSFSNFYAIEGISDLEAYYKKRADEELLHHQWCLHYLTEADYKFTYPKIDENMETFSTYEDPFKLTVDREIQTTQMIYRIYEAAIAEKDYMTASWLYGKLIKEQIEEENTSRMALRIIEEESDIYLRAQQIYNLIN